MNFKNEYNCLNQNIFSIGEYKIIPLRFEDRLDIMKWRNEQMYHLRQDKPLTQKSQDNYFNGTVAKLFDQEKPNQILFSYLKNDELLGYGGLVHINWIDKNAEISFVLNTKDDKEFFKFHWCSYLALLEEVAFNELELHKIYTYAFDLRPHLYEALEESGYRREATLKEHCFFDEEFFDVVIHQKTRKRRPYLRLAKFEDASLLFDWANDPDVRQNALNSKPIIWENHLKWLQNKLNSNQTNIFIFQSEEEVVGQIRIDKIEKTECWLIDYSIDKEFRGNGYGLLILKDLIRLNPGKELKGFVKKQNIPSQKVFEKLKFEKQIIEEKELIEYTYVNE